MMIKTQRSTSGFSLVELSIVLVILGLLTGGILAGKSLIRASELRTVTQDVQAYTTATFAFRDKYFQLPGDMSNATSFWGAQDSGDGLGTDCTDVASSSSLTCNGDGSGTICLSNAQCYEMHRYWQHLANAGLISGSFTGAAGNTGTQSGSTPGVNAPIMRLSNVTLQPRTMGTRSGYAELYDGYYGTSYYIGIPSCPTCNPNRSFASTEEAWNIDTKVDDGKPAIGKVRTYKYGNVTSWAGDSAACANSATIATAEYNLSLSGTSCQLLWTFLQ